MLTRLTNILFPRLSTGKEADNRLARIADINQNVIDVLNKMDIFSSDKFTMLLSQSGATISGSVVERKCVSGGSGCWSCLNTCAYQNSNAVTSFAETSPGVYRLVINPENYTPYEAVDVQVGNLPVFGTVAVEKISDTVFQISTFDNAGLAARLFDNTKVTVTFYKKTSTAEFLD